jgi:hypothetical protein
MVEVKWRLPLMRFRVCSLSSLIGNDWLLIFDKMETERGHLGRPVEHLEGKDGESVVAILRFLCGSSRPCQLRTQGLVHMSRYWTYQSHAGDIGSVSLVTFLQQVIGLITLLQWMRGEVGSTFFSGAVHPSNPIDDLVKGCYTWTMWDTYVRGPYVDRAWKACDVLVRFFHTGCTSIQIVVTLRYESPLVCGCHQVVIY